MTPTTWQGWLVLALVTLAVVGLHVMCGGDEQIR